jgi:hypothetical protein
MAGRMACLTSALLDKIGTCIHHDPASTSSFEAHQDHSGGLLPLHTENPGTCCKQARGMADYPGVDKVPRYNHASRIVPPSCTVSLPEGGFCDANSAPDMPFAICAQHAVLLYRRMQEMVTEVQVNHRDFPDIHAAAVEGVHERGNTSSHQVYYVQVGPLIKIGVTKQLRQRLAKYPPGSELLAVEQGGEDMEGRRHRQFCHLLAERKEWFHPGADLMDHIAKLAAKAG